MRSPELRWATVRVAAVAMLAWSCSSLPTEPTPAPKNPTPTFVRVAAPPSGAFGATSGSSTTASLAIDGAVGGSIDCGNFTVIIPAGAISGKATVTITVPDPAVMHCQLSVSPPVANTLAIPIRLVANCSTASNLSAWAMQTLRYDMAIDQWVIVPGSEVNTVDETITTPLSDFSEYGVVDGKAGW